MSRTGFDGASVKPGLAQDRLGREHGRVRRDREHPAWPKIVSGANTVVSGETASTYSRPALCSRARNSVLSPYAQSPITGAGVISQPSARSISSTPSSGLVLNSTSAGIFARRRRSGWVHQSWGRYSAHPSGTVPLRPTACTHTPIWQLPIFPTVPEYWRLTPGERFPSFREPSVIQYPLERVSKIVGAMRSFAHPPTTTREPVDLNDVVHTTLMVAANEYKYVADVSTQLN
jgi:hypothetical protein